jgi:peptidoglycan/xylan/chitin deacetylase (PgdA/CDA1 family)
LSPFLPARRSARVAVVAGSGLAAGAVVHLLPGVATLRRFRCAFLPTLAGVGSPAHVALTFDDGPDPKSTPAFLDALDGLRHPVSGQAGWKATFFLLGDQVQRHPDLAAEVRRRGHELAVHGCAHHNHLRRSAHWASADLQRAVELIGEATGQAPRWFRPPYGALAASSLVAARRQHLPVVLWTSWGRDWQAEATPETVVANIAASWHAGATVLLHDSDVTSAPGSWRAALGALPILAERWTHQGLAVGPLGEHGLQTRPVDWVRRPARW